MTAMKKQENLKKFKQLTSDEVSPWEQEALQREAAAPWQVKSAAIALQVLRCLREQKMSQTALAARLQVTPQYIHKIVKGHENLSLETITKLEQALNTSLISIYVGEHRRIGAGPRFPAMRVQYAQQAFSELAAVQEAYSQFAPDRFFDSI